MAVTRKFLEAMGLDDSKISAIIEEHDKTVQGLKEVRDKYKADADKLAEVQKELDELKGGENWQSKYTDLKKMFDDYKTEVQTKETNGKIKAAYADLLKAANIDENRIEAILKITDMSGMKLDDSGKLIDADKLSEGIKKEWSAFVTSTSTKGVNVETPPVTKSTQTITKADIYAKDDKGHYKMSTADRQKALIDHPELMR